jgi:ABC-type glycerol-3-phosphate transport system substrate-binding protein
MKKNASQDKRGRSPGKVKRREFLGRTAAGAALATAGAIFGGQPPAFAQSRVLRYLQWSSFIPDADIEIKRQCREFEKAAGVTVKEEFINQNDMPPRITAAIESGKGADVMLLINNQPHLFANGLDNHDKLIGELAGSGLYDWASGAVVVDGTARGVPLFNIGNAIVYRKDIFDELGLKAPNTWEEYLATGTTLKKNNWPVGQTLGHTFGDAPSFAYPMLWTFGGMEVNESGRVDVDTAQSRQALEFMREFWESACDPGGLAWDDGSNNRAFLGQTIGATLNGASAEARPRQQPGRPRWTLPHHRPAQPQRHELLEGEGRGCGFHPLPVPGGQFRQLHHRQQRLHPGVDAEVGEPRDLGLRPGVEDLQHQREVRPQLRLRRSLESGVGRGFRRLSPPGRRRSSRTSTADRRFRARPAVASATAGRFSIAPVATTQAP